MKFIAFHNGNLIPDNILDLIIDQAKRGKMTDAAKKLILIPDKRRGKTDVSGLREIASVKRRDCITLSRYSLPFRKNLPKPKKAKKHPPKPLK